MEWSKFPAEVKLAILERVDGRSLITSRLVSREFFNIADKGILHDRVPRVTACHITSHNHRNCHRATTMLMDRDTDLPDPFNSWERVDLSTGHHRLVDTITDPERKLYLLTRHFALCSISVNNFREMNENWDEDMRARAMDFLWNAYSLRRTLVAGKILLMDSFTACIGRRTRWLELPLEQWDELPLFKWGPLLAACPSLRRITIPVGHVDAVRRHYDGDMDADLLALGWLVVKGFSATPSAFNYYKPDEWVLRDEQHRYAILQALGHARCLRHLFGPVALMRPERVETVLHNAEERGLVPQADLILLATAAHCIIAQPSAEDLYNIVCLLMPFEGWAPNAMDEKHRQLRLCGRRLCRWFNLPIPNCFS